MRCVAWTESVLLALFAVCPSALVSTMNQYVCRHCVTISEMPVPCSIIGRLMQTRIHFVIGLYPVVDFCSSWLTHHVTPSVSVVQTKYLTLIAAGLSCYIMAATSLTRVLYTALLDTPSLSAWPLVFISALSLFGMSTGKLFIIVCAHVLVDVYLCSVYFLLGTAIFQIIWHISP